MKKVVLHQIKVLTLTGCVIWAQLFGENKNKTAGWEYDALAYFYKFYPRDAQRLINEIYPVVD